MTLDDLEKYQRYLNDERTAHRKALRERKKLERFVCECRDPHIRSIIINRYIKGLSWTATALEIGGGVTGDNCRKMVARFIK